MSDTFKVIVAGGRDFDDYFLLSTKCEKYLKNKHNIEIVSGGARGADELGEMFAKENHYQLSVFPANWGKYGKAAVAIRNTEMAEYAHALIAFWDGKSRGTKNMIDTARNLGLEVRVVRYD